MRVHIWYFRSVECVFQFWKHVDPYPVDVMVTCKRPNPTSSLSDPVHQLFSSFDTLKMINTQILIPSCMKVHIWYFRSAEFPFQSYKLISSSRAVFCRTADMKPLDMIGPPKFQRLQNTAPPGCQRSVREPIRRCEGERRCERRQKSPMFFAWAVTFFWGKIKLRTDRV